MMDWIQGIEHVQITVHQLEVSLPFYQMLGFTQHRTIRNDTEEYTVVVLMAGFVGIELVQFDQPEPRTIISPSISMSLRPLGYRHLALRVESVQEWCHWAASEDLPFFGRQLTA